MQNSANKSDEPSACTPTLSGRMQKTRLSITRHCRDLTAEFGFNGFTIEQACERVGISRRTFFNYFPGKLDAVFGHGTEELPEGAIDRFMAARPEGIEGISPTLLADLVALVLEQLSFDEKAIVSTHGFFAAARREPELLQHMMQSGPKKVAEFLERIGSREVVEPDHPASPLVIHTLHFATFQAIERYAAGSGESSLGDLFLEHIAQGQQVLSQPLRRASE